MKYLSFFVICCVLLVTGCKDNSVEPDTIYVGGQIKNPETDFVVISRENEIVDTLYLDEKNQFGKDYQSLEGGIYTFRHPPESQIMYMEPGDSIVIWLNTMAFDQSLNFSGDGAEKSNFLLDMFLKNQKNNDLILTYHKMEPEEFAQVTDSIRTERLNALEALKERVEFSEEFMEIANASINFEYYDLRERYTFLIKKYYNDLAAKLPDDFHDYRKKLDFNNEKLQDYYLYTNFIDDFLRTKSIEHCDEHHEDKNVCYNLNSFKNIRRRMFIIDSLSEIEPLKNEFIDRLAVRAITMAENESRIDSILKTLKKINYSNLEEIEELASFQRFYFVGNSLKDLTAKNTDGELIKYGEVINGPTMTYAWSLYAPAHHRWQHQIIKDLQEKYPELNFLGVNIDVGEREEWLRTIESFGYDKSNEYQVAKRPISNENLKKYLNKVFFVAADGTIVRGDVHLGSPEFESELQEFLNKQK